MSRILAAASIGLVVVALAGCSTARPGADPTPKRTATASPSASTPAAPDLTEPASLIPGDCAQLVADPIAVAGVPVADAGVSSNGPRQRQAGDLSCSWRSSTARNAVSLSLEVRRHAAVLAADPLGWWSPSGTPAGVGADASALDCHDSVSAGSSCRVQSRIGDYWFDLLLITPTGVSAAARRGPLVAAASALVRHLASSPVPAEWTPPSGAWPSVVDCAAVGAHADVAGAVGDPAVTVSDTTIYGDEFTMSDAVARLGGASECTWGDPRPDRTFSSVSAMMTAGAGWSLATAPTGAETLVIPGADVAVISCSADGGCGVSARIGVNTVSVSDRAVSAETDITPDRAQIIAAATQVVAGLRAVYP